MCIEIMLIDRWKRLIYERINKRSCKISRDSRTKTRKQGRVIPYQIENFVKNYT